MTLDPIFQTAAFVSAKPKRCSAALAAGAKPESNSALVKLSVHTTDSCWVCVEGPNSILAVN